MNKEFDNTLRIKLSIHIGCTLESAIIKGSLIYKNDRSKLNKNIIKVINKVNDMLRDILNVMLNEDEACYITEMLE